MNVVPNSARITVITKDSKYSRGVDFLNVVSAIEYSLQSLPGRRLFGCFLGQTESLGDRLAINKHFDGKYFLVVGSFFAPENIIGVPAVLRLELLLKRTLDIAQLTTRIAHIFPPPF